MNIFNRAVLLLLGLLVLVCGAATGAVAAGWLPPQSFAGTPWLYERLAPLAQLGGPSAFAAVAVSTALMLLAALLLVFELGTAGRERAVLTLYQDRSGLVSLDRRVVRDLARSEALTVPGVAGCKVDARIEHGGLALVGRLTVDRSANLFDVSRSARDHMWASVERSLGQTVREVRLRCTADSARRWSWPDLAWPRLAVPQEKGELLVQMRPLQLIEHAGPVVASVAATLAVIAGILVIVYPVILAWAVGISLILAGVAALVAIFTTRAEELQRDGSLARQTDAR